MGAFRGHDITEIMLETTLILSQTTNFRLFETKTFHTTTLNLMEMAESYEQFLLFPQCFQNTSTADT